MAIPTILGILVAVALVALYAIITAAKEELNLRALARNIILICIAGIIVIVLVTVF